MGYERPQLGSRGYGPLTTNKRQHPTAPFSPCLRVKTSDEVIESKSRYLGERSQRQRDASVQPGYLWYR